MQVATLHACGCVRKKLWWLNSLETAVGDPDKAQGRLSSTQGCTRSTAEPPASAPKYVNSGDRPRKDMITDYYEPRTVNSLIQFHQYTRQEVQILRLWCNVILRLQTHSESIFFNHK